MYVLHDTFYSLHMPISTYELMHDRLFNISYYRTTFDSVLYSTSNRNRLLYLKIIS